jgi:hypothetical protein
MIASVGAATCGVFAEVWFKAISAAAWTALVVSAEFPGFRNAVDRQIDHLKALPGFQDNLRWEGLQARRILIASNTRW